MMLAAHASCNQWVCARNNYGSLIYCFTDILYHQKKCRNSAQCSAYQFTFANERCTQDIPAATCTAVSERCQHRRAFPDHYHFTMSYCIKRKSTTSVFLLQLFAIDSRMNA